MVLVTDTGPVLAAFNPRDEHHAPCSRLLADTREAIVVPAPVIVELDYWLSRYMGPRSLVGFLHDLSRGAFEVENLIEDDYRRVTEICAQYSDSDIGFVDAAVLEVVERLNEPKLATIDHRHFRMLRPRHVAALDLLPHL